MSKAFNFDNFDLSNLKAKIVFDAIPSTLVALNNTTKKNKNIYYMMVGLYYETTEEYLIAFYTYKKRTRLGIMSFVLIDNQIEVFKNKMKVVDFMYSFLEKFTPHERLINSTVNESEPLPLNEILVKISEWLQAVGEYFITKNSK
jgi:hypothetical protein